jgi:DtxR family Mn-dependent transcriptional regulator
MEQREIEEILELIWTLREEHISDKSAVLESTDEKNPAGILQRMQQEGLITVSNNQIKLTGAGEKYAEKIIRRHRLAERLFSDVFRMNDVTLEKEACTWEHVLSEDVTDSVCSFLGHPRVCPHNKPIPPGQCCIRYKKEKTISPLVQPLHAVAVGTTVKIVYMLPSLQKRLERLTNLGILPGARLRIKQKSPALVVLCEETTIALDAAVGSEIYVIALNGEET